MIFVILGNDCFILLENKIKEVRKVLFATCVLLFTQEIKRDAGRGERTFLKVELLTDTVYNPFQ